MAETLGIIADDLTGAMDGSGYIACRGFSTVIIFDMGVSSAADVVVINTNSRADDENTAREKAKQAARNLAGRLVYKKIDSTLRGNIGVELEAVMEELAFSKAIVAPAFPAMGRTTAGGILLVDGVSVSQSQFAHDPICPVKESHIPSLLEQSTHCGVGNIGVESIAAGPESLYQEISGVPQEIVVCDVAAQSHLACIVQAAALARGKWLLCGSGGLARELPSLLSKTTKASRAASSTPKSGLVLAVVGTRNQVTANQLLKARDELALPILNLEFEPLDQEDACSKRAERIAEQVRPLLGQEKGLVLSATFSRYVPDLRHSITVVMAEAVAGILTLRKFAGLFLSGGDIAIEVCRRLSVSAISVRGEIEPGVPAGELVGGQYQGMRVVTKAGGFGTELAIVRSISYLEKGELP